MELQYAMPYSAYKEMLELNGIKSCDDLLKYINETYGLLGTVVQIVFDGD